MAPLVTVLCGVGLQLSLSMVVVGDYSVRLVDAGTKEPFQEHVGPNGDIYAEVEPEAQYFVELNVVNNAAGAADKVIMDGFIDGKRVPNHVTVRPGRAPYFLGLIETDPQGAKRKTAFCFRSPKVATDTSTSGTAAAADGLPGMMMGSVTVQVSEAVPRGSRPFRSYSPDIFLPTPPAAESTVVSSTVPSGPTTEAAPAAGSSSTANVGSSTAPAPGLVPVPTSASANRSATSKPVAMPFPLTKKQEKKVLRTVPGNFAEVTHPAPVQAMPVQKRPKKVLAPASVTATLPSKPKPVRFQAGDILQEIHIHYCTAFGLIRANILPKSPLWDQHRSTFAADSGNDGEGTTVDVPCQKIQVDAVFQGDTMISATKELDFFDLTQTRSP